MKKFGLSAEHIAAKAKEMVGKKEKVVISLRGCSPS